MGLLDDAIREHLELKRRHGADSAEISRQEREILGAGGPAVPEAAEPDEATEPDAVTGLDDVPLAAEPAVEDDADALDDPLFPHTDELIEAGAAPVTTEPQAADPLPPAPAPPAPAPTPALGATPAPSDADPDESIAVSSPSAFEEREVLHALLGEKRSRREAETMEWLVREHAGERLADIASENGVPAPVVRQRVSRLRRALRSRWTGVFGLVALLAGLSALGLAAYDPREAIAPDPAVDLAVAPTVPASASPADILVREAAGEWIVQTVTPSRPLSTAEKRLVDTQAKGAKLRVRKSTIELEAPGFKTTWKITSLKKTARGVRVGLTNEKGGTDTADVVFLRDASGARLDVTLHHARFGGMVSLRRPIL